MEGISLKTKSDAINKINKIKFNRKYHYLMPKCIHSMRDIQIKKLYSYCIILGILDNSLKFQNSARNDVRIEE